MSIVFDGNTTSTRRWKLIIAGRVVSYFGSLAEAQNAGLSILRNRKASR